MVGEELTEHFEGLEHVFVADTDAEEPRALAEAKRRPDLCLGRRPQRSW